SWERRGSTSRTRPRRAPPRRALRRALGNSIARWPRPKTAARPTFLPSSRDLRRESAPSSAVHSCQFVVKVGESFDAQMEIVEHESLVRRVRVLVRLAETHEQAGLAGRVGDRADEGDRPSLADEYRLFAERFREGAL